MTPLKFSSIIFSFDSGSLETVHVNSFFVWKNVCWLTHAHISRDVKTYEVGVALEDGLESHCEQVDRQNFCLDVIELNNFADDFRVGQQDGN